MPYDPFTPLKKIFDEYVPNSPPGSGFSYTFGKMRSDPRVMEIAKQSVVDQLARAKKEITKDTLLELASSYSSGAREIHREVSRVFDANGGDYPHDLGKRTRLMAREIDEETFRLMSHLIGQLYAEDWHPNRPTKAVSLSAGEANDTSGAKPEEPDAEEGTPGASQE